MSGVTSIQKEQRRTGLVMSAWTSVTCASSDLVTTCIDGTFTNIARETTTDFTLPESPPPRSLGSFQFVRGRLLTPLGQLWGLNGS